MEQGLILGHGSGSFGHVAALRHGFANEGAPSARAAAEVARAASRLHGLVLDALLAADVPAFSWSPSTVLESRGGRRLSGGLGALETALQSCLVPVLYGDVVLDTLKRASIASTEALVRHVESRLRRRGWRLTRLIWLGETGGVWDADGQLVPRIDASNYATLRRAVGGSAGTYVTGGMLLRLDTAWHLAQRGVASLIADGQQPGLLAAALRGEEVPGTLVTAG